MKILDTNLWVFGTLRTNERAVELLASIESGTAVSAINAYVVQESLSAFGRVDSLSPEQRDAIKTRFLTRLTRMSGLIQAPSSRDVAESIVHEKRSAPKTRLLARICDIQAKDVPILVLAFDHAEREPTILTNDEAFADLRPAAHSIPEIGIEYVD